MKALLFIVLTIIPSLSFGFISPQKETDSNIANNKNTIQISWQDLRGKVEPYYDPFRALTQDQIYNISIYGRILELQKELPDKVTDEMKKKAQEAKAKLIAEKIDIGGLFAQRKIIVEKRRAAAMVTNDLFTNKQIEIAGYLLALEFNEGLVTEFLLVPTVGACSHKPVPAANQLILVKSKIPFEAGSPFIPVRVSGSLQTIQQNKRLHLVDGNKQVQMAYFVDEAIVREF